MSNRRDRLTTQQERALAVLKAHPGEWMTSLAVLSEIDPDAPTDIRAASYMGCSIRGLPLKVEGLEVRYDGKQERFEFAWVGGDTEEALVPNIRSIAPAVGAQKMKSNPAITAAMPTEDAALVSEALLAYSTALVTAEPMKALRAAYLAGKGVAIAFATDAGSQARKLSPSAGPRSTVEPPKPEPPAAEMPDDMTYDEMCDEIEKSGVKFGHSWAEFASRVGMDPEYFERIATRQGHPSKHTMERVYAAIFTPHA